MYGVAQTGETTSWHYWEERNFHASREFGMDPHHSFDLERDVIQVRPSLVSKLTVQSQESMSNPATAHQRNRSQARNMQENNLQRVALLPPLKYKSPASFWLLNTIVVRASHTNAVDRPGWHDTVAEPRSV